MKIIICRLNCSKFKTKSFSRLSKHSASTQQVLCKYSASTQQVLSKTRQDSARLFKSPLKVLALKILGLCIGIFKKYSHSHKGLFFKKVYFSFPFKSFLVLLLQGKRRLGRRSSPLLVLHNGRFLSAR